MHSAPCAVYVERLKDPTVLSKTQRNRAVLLRTRFTVLWRSEIHINLKIDADVLNRRWRRFCVRRKICRIYQGKWRKYAGKCAWVDVICSVKCKINNETSIADCTSNLTYPNLNTPKPCNTEPRRRDCTGRLNIIKMREVCAVPSALCRSNF
jgi:hypothetical protein